jgi:ATP-dependent Clp protease protease subunit
MPKKKSKSEEVEPEIELGELVSQVHNYDVNLHTREIYLHSHYSSGHMDEEGGIEYRMATQFVKNLHILDLLDQKNILIHLQSPGGDWSHGMAMFDAIEHAKSSVSMLAHGEINSMSGILFQSADKRVMMPHCEIMVHRGFLSLEGITTSVQSNAAWNKKTDQMMLKIYAKKAVNGAFFKKKKMSIIQVADFIDKKIKKLGDWNLNAEEAVHFGLADGVFGNDKFSLDEVRHD